MRKSRPNQRAQLSNKSRQSQSRNPALRRQNGVLAVDGYARPYLNTSLGRLSEEKNGTRRPTDLPGGRSANAVEIPYMPVFNSAIRKRLLYYDYANLGSTSGAPATYIFSANGLYDPNISGTGHQPSGFDQLMIFYDHYVVTQAKCTVTCHNTVQVVTPTVVLALNSTNSSPSDIISLMESGFLVRERLNQAPYDDSIKTLSLAVDISKFQGVPKPRDDPELWGSVAANPLEQSYFNITLFDPSGGSSTIAFSVVIEYEAWFIEPRKISPSLAKMLHATLLTDEKQRCQGSLPITSWR